MGQAEQAATDRQDAAVLGQGLFVAANEFIALPRSCG
jgi:hypothetical protein